LQGINKPIIQEKVDEMAKSMKGKKPSPLIAINQFHGIRPQTPGKKILMDGHHRLEACKANNVSDVPIYKGTYTGAAERPHKELLEKTAKAKSLFAKLKDCKIPLTPEERALVMNRKAVWHFNGGSPSPAVWKSRNPDTGKITYITNTHRAWNQAPTVKGAIGRFHNFIKSTS